MVPLHVRPAAYAARHVLNKHSEDPLSPAAIQSFFRSYYWAPRSGARRAGCAPGVLDKLVGAHGGHNYPYAAIAEGSPDRVPASPAHRADTT